jgi:hypothetical protein
VPEYSATFSSYDRLSDILITPAKVLLAIKRLKLSGAAGPDYTHLSFLQQTAISSVYTFNSAIVPDEWRKTFVTPIFKKGTSLESDANNYRPISLTCVGCKLMENILNREILDFLLKDKHISQHRHGFLAKCLTCMQLPECLNDWTLNTKNKHATNNNYALLKLLTVYVTQNCK